MPPDGLSAPALMISADSSGLRLLRDCAGILEKAHTCEPNWLRSELFNMSDAPWSTWGKNGSGLTTFTLKQWLKDYAIKPKTVRVSSGPGEGLSRRSIYGRAGPLSGSNGGDGYPGYIGYNVDNKNNDVTGSNRGNRGGGGKRQRPFR